MMRTFHLFCQSMDIFLQTGADKFKICDENDDKIFLLQVKVDKVDKEVLNIPKVTK